MLVLKVVVGVVLALVVYFYVVAPSLNAWAFQARCEARGGYTFYVAGRDGNGPALCTR
jgi:hypothetical protein